MMILEATINFHTIQHDIVYYIMSHNLGVFANLSEEDLEYI